MNIDVLNKENIKNLTKANAPIEVLAETDSTNLYLKAKATNLPEGAAVIAEKQTAGRGRFTRKFHSPENCGIYMSVLLRPEIPAEDAVLITAATAVCVCEAIEQLCRKDTQIKWVNDILINSKKVCGILAESVLNPKNGTIERTVVGIGINVYEPENGFSRDIKDIAGFIENEQTENLRNRICAEIINRLLYHSRHLKERSFLADYRKRSAVIGKTVNVIGDSKTETATALEIDDNCRLLVEYPNKTRQYLNSGEISIKI